MRQTSCGAVFAAAMLCVLWVAQAQAAPLSPLVQGPVIGGIVQIDGDLAPDGEIFALVEGDLSAPPVFDAPEPVLSGGTFLLSANGTPGFDLVADFVLVGVGGDFDPDVPFLSGVMEDIGFDATLVTLIFGNVDGQAATLFGPRVLVSIFDFGALPPGGGVFSTTGSYTIQALAPIAPVPLPLPGLMLLGGMAGLALLRRVS